MEEAMRRPVTAPSRTVGTTAAVRQRNLALALQLVISGRGDMTRAEIARTTGLTPATVSSLLAELMELRYVRAGHHLASSGGKPPLTFHVDPTHHGLLVVRVESTYAEAALFDLTGAVVTVRRTGDGAGITPGRVADLAVELATASSRPMIACAVEVPGTISDGVVVESVQLGWTDVPIATIVGDATNVPTYTINDANAGALAELGSEEPQENLLFLHLGRGVGAAIVFGGALLQGARVGEIGHVRMEFEGSATHCRCGLFGCLEASASMSAVLGAEQYEKFNLRNLDELLRHPPVLGRLHHAGRVLARAVRLIAASLDLSVCIVGGDAWMLGERFVDVLQEELDRHRARGARPITVRPARSSNPFIGAAQYALGETLHVRWNAPSPDTSGVRVP